MRNAAQRYAEERNAPEAADKICEPKAKLSALRSSSQMQRGSDMQLRCARGNNLHAANKKDNDLNIKLTPFLKHDGVVLPRNRRPHKRKAKIYAAADQICNAAKANLGGGTPSSCRGPDVPRVHATEVGRNPRGKLRYKIIH
jgi:hypothetical protein